MTPAGIIRFIRWIDFYKHANPLDLKLIDSVIYIHNKGGAKRKINFCYICTMTSDNQNICIHCGLCCDGTLFYRAKIKENEQIATSFSFEILVSEKRAFKLPCAYLNGKVCSIYQERPYSICESFQCKLLKALKTGNIPFDDAMKIIVDATALKTKIEQQLFEYHPDNKDDSLQNKMKEFNSHFKGTISEIEFRKKYGKMVLDYYILNEILDKKFKNDKKRADISG